MGPEGRGMGRLGEVQPTFLCMYFRNLNPFSQFELESPNNVSDQLGLIFKGRNIEQSNL